MAERNINDVLLETGIQSISQLPQIMQQRKLMLEKEANKKFERLQSQQNVFLKIAGDKSFSDNIRSSAGKNLIAINNELNPEVPLPSFDKFDKPVNDFFVNLNVLNQLKDKGTITPEQFKQGFKLLSSDALNQAKSEGQRGELQDAIKFQQEQSFGSGSPQEFQIGGQTQLGRLTPTNDISLTSSQQEPVSLPAKPLAAESAGKASSTQLGLKDLANARDILFPSGTAKGFDPIAGITAQFKIPKTKGKEAARLLDNALEVKIRSESGAAVPDSEINRLKKRFGINILTDTPEEMFNKLARLEFVFNNFLFQLDPQNKLKLIPKNGEEQNTPSNPAQEGTSSPIKINSIKRIK